MATILLLSISSSIISNEIPYFLILKILNDIPITLKSLGVLTTGVTFYLRNSTGNDFPLSSFLFYQFSFESNILYFNFNSSTSGEVFCIFEYNANPLLSLTYENLILGYARDGTLAYDYTFTSVFADTEYQLFWNFAGIQDPGKFIVTCNLCNSYSPIPHCLDEASFAYYDVTWNSYQPYFLIPTISLILAII